MAEKIAAGIEATMKDMRDRGWETKFCAVMADSSAETTIAEALLERWDCIVIGGGIRIPSRGLLLFERVINGIHRGAPGTPIAYYTSPVDSGDAAARWIGRP